MPVCGPAAAPVHCGLCTQRQQEEAPRAALHPAQWRRISAGGTKQGAGPQMAQSMYKSALKWDAHIKKLVW